MSHTAFVIKEEINETLGNQPSNENINMITNIKDHISCSKSMETFNSQDSKVGILSFPCDFDHMYASMTNEMASCKEKNECKHLKEICLHHLDLIQQQSEIIAKHEKQIQALRQENETLKQRLQRMDRRVILHKSNDMDSPDADTTSAASPRNIGRSPVSPRSTDNPKRPRSRSRENQIAEPTCLSPTRWDETSAQLAHSEDGAASVSSGCEVPDDSSSTTASQHYPSHTPITSASTQGRKDRKKRTLSTGSKENSANSRQASSDRRPAKRAKKSAVPAAPVLTTNQPYYTAMGDSEVAWKSEEPEENQVNGDFLEIPQWRIKVYTSLYSMEGTENLDDEVFNKRHQRLELDERRRKRWDVQRIREQRHIEKLRQRELSGHNALSGFSGPELLEDEPVASLWPSPEDAQYLEVADELPVAAFGLPITKFTPSEFSLPWLQSGQKRQTTPTSSSKTVGRRRSAPGSSTRRKRIVRSSGSRASLSLAGRKRETTERK